MKILYSVFLLLLTLLVMGQVVVNPPTPPISSAGLDQAFGNTRGSLLERGATGWTILPPAASGILASNGIGADPSYHSYPIINVLDPPYNAACNGSTDDTSAIQAAITALPNDGGTVQIPVANCVISSTLNIGNGTTSAASTKRGIILRGVAAPGQTGAPYWTNYPVPTGPRLTWTGGAGSMISVNGPLSGWGVQNLILDCQSATTSIGITVTSASYGDNSNLAFRNCASRGINSTSNPVSGYSGIGLVNVDSLRNSWSNVNVLVPPIIGAIGILLSGEAGGSSDTDFNVFTNTFVRLNGAPASSHNFGVYLGVSDTNSFNNLSVSGGNSTNSVGVQLDYTINASFPTGNVIYTVDNNSTVQGQEWQQAGSPGASTRPNIVGGVFEGNGSVWPNLSGWNVTLPMKGTPDIALTGQTAAIGATTFYSTYQAANWRVCWNAAASTVGSGGTWSVGFNWNDGVARSLVVGTVNANTTGSQNVITGCTLLSPTISSALQYFVNFNSVTGPLTYNLNITSERLD